MSLSLTFAASQTAVYSFLRVRIPVSPGGCSRGRIWAPNHATGADSDAAVGGARGDCVKSIRSSPSAATTRGVILVSNETINYITTSTKVELMVSNIIFVYFC